MPHCWRVAVVLLGSVAVAFASLSWAAEDGQTFRAGAAAVEITPTTLPVVVSGGFLERTADTVHDRLFARAVVLDDGAKRLAIVVADNLMMPRDLLDRAKSLAERATGIPVDHLLISATHTHSAPSVMGALGSRSDVVYERVLPELLARAIEQAAGNLAPARVGWCVVQDAEHNYCRRWVFREDRMINDPFGQRTVRAHMHPGYESPNHIGPSGPADPDLSVLALQFSDGRPLAVLANYAMHYFGSTPVSADVCGRFGGALAARIGAAQDERFVGMLSQGTSGDSMWMDYSRPAAKITLQEYTDSLAQVAAQAYQTVQFHDWVSIDIAETKLTIGRRAPGAERLEWARGIAATIGDRLPRDHAEVYALEQLYLHAQPEVELKLQAIRIGELGITGIPNEVYGLTGLKLKARSPLQPTFNIELANGAEGYIPPPEQHALGGYTTWPARTAGLAVEAEPQIVAALLGLLEKVAGKPAAVPTVDIRAAYPAAVLKSAPLAYWRLEEMDGVTAADCLDRYPAQFERGVAFFLPGPSGEQFSEATRGNRCAHFAGGRLASRMDKLGSAYTVEFWFWNGLPHDARAVTGYLFSRGEDGAEGAPGDHLGIGGTHQPDLTGKLFFYNGNQRKALLIGKTSLETRTWYHVAMARDGSDVRVYLNGQPEADISGAAEPGCSSDVGQLFFGGRNDRLFPLEGQLDEVAVYDRILSPAEIAAHFTAGR